MIVSNKHKRKRYFIILVCVYVYTSKKSVRVTVAVKIMQSLWWTCVVVFATQLRSSLLQQDSGGRCTRYKLEVGLVVKTCLHYNLCLQDGSI